MHRSPKRIKLSDNCEVSCSETNKKSHAPSSSTNILSLYPEILLQIFQSLEVPDLCSVSKVCKYWYEVVNDKRLWKQFELKLHLRSNNKYASNMLVRRGVNKIQMLSFAKNSNLQELSKLKLTTLNFVGCCNMNDKVIKKNFINFSCLTSLNLSLCKQVNDISIVRISINCPSLTSLELGNCSITNNSLLILSFKLRKLTKLNLSSCSSINTTGISYLVGLNADYHLIRLNKFLNKFHLLDNDLSFSSQSKCSICQQNLDGQLQWSKKLKNNNLQNWEKIDSSAESGLENLETLILQNCQKISDESISHLKKLKNLKHINLSHCNGISDVGLKHLGQCQNLLELNLNSCGNITDEGLNNISPIGPKLQQLDISFCINVTNVGLKYIANSIRNLRFLSLSFCHNITDEGILLISNNLKELVQLKMGQCSKLTDESLKNIVKYLSNLQSIDLYGCTNISQSGLDTIMTMSNLKKLNRNLLLS